MRPLSRYAWAVAIFIYRGLCQSLINKEWLSVPTLSFILFNAVWDWRQKKSNYYAIQVYS